VSKVYISLTTVPSRLLFNNGDHFSLELVLTSLLSQHTSRDYEVWLHIPTEYKLQQGITDIPDWLYKLLLEHPKLQVNRTIDRGPITKLVGMLDIAIPENSIIIVCDDDQYYHPHMIEYHLKKHLQYENEDVAICFRGNRAQEKRSWTLVDGTRVYRFYDTHSYMPPLTDIYLEVPDHFNTVSYRRSYLTNDLLNESFLGMGWNDDQLMSYYAASHGIRFLCASYDDEVDFRPVNCDGRGAHSFPIIYSVPYPSDTGCDVLRKHYSTLEGNASEVYTEHKHKIYEVRE